MGWIDNNETSSESGKLLAEKSYQLAKVFLPLAEKHFTTLQEKINE
jgi:hypothetical protein